VSDDEEPLPVLWDAMIHGVQELPLNFVTHSPQATDDRLEIFLVLIPHPAYVLEQCQPGSDPFDSGQEGREAIPVVPVAVLVSVDREGLAGWPAHDDVRTSQELGLGAEENLVTLGLEICPIGLTRWPKFLVADRPDSCCLEPESKPTAPGEQIERDQTR
jgi:hypothetical protein